MMGGPAIRKQVFDLRPEDFASTPIWEFALDEEGASGQDEATVRPRPDLKHADPFVLTFPPASVAVINVELA